MRKLVTVICVVLACHGFAETDSEMTSRFLSQLAAKGYIVRAASWLKFEKETCQLAIEVFGNCFGNNPAAPYLIPVIPHVPGEYIDASYDSGVRGITPPGTGMSFRLDANEAIVFIGKSPPEAAYFGMQSYLFSRQGVASPTFLFSLIEKALPTVTGLFFDQMPNPDRYSQFASLGDSTNDVQIANSKGLSHGFNTSFQWISTANAEVALALQSELTRAGASPQNSFIEKLPQELKVGLDSSNDDLITLLRYAIPRDPEAANHWRSNPTIKAYRISSPETKVSRYGKISYAPRTATSQRRMKSTLSMIAAEVAKRLAIPSTVPQKTFLSMDAIGLRGSNCIARSMNCLGDSMDTDTYRLARVNALENRDAIVIVGVNQVVMKNATYSSLAIQRLHILEGVSSINQTAAPWETDNALTGSVDRFFKATGGNSPSVSPSILDSYFVKIVARDCSGIPECVSVSSEVPLNSELGVLQRNYIKPDTTSGADPSDLLSPVYYHWTR